MTLLVRLSARSLLILQRIKTCAFDFFKMPTWNQIQGQLRHPSNPVVFLDVTVGSTVRLKLIFV